MASSGSVAGPRDLRVHRCVRGCDAARACARVGPGDFQALFFYFFNMLWLYQLGGQIETQESSRSVAVMVLVFASLCNTAQYLVSGPLFVGMSGVVYGLLGYIWMMTRFQVGTRYMLSEQTVTLMLLWLGFGLVGIIPHIANTEHVVGMLLGVVWGFVRSGGWSQMRRRRRFSKQLS